MELIPKTLYEKYKKDCELNQQKLVSDQLVRCKLFDPCSNWSRFITDYDPETKIAFGFVVGLENEWGDIRIPELEQYKGRLGIGIERDRRFNAKPFKDLHLEND